MHRLADASCACNLCVKDVLIQLDLQISGYNEALFYWNKDSQLRRTIIIHVDTFYGEALMSFKTKSLIK